MSSIYSGNGASVLETVAIRHSTRQNIFGQEFRVVYLSVLQTGSSCMIKFWTDLLDVSFTIGDMTVWF